MAHMLIFHAEYSYFLCVCVCVWVGVGVGVGVGVVEVAFLSQVLNIPERINQTCNTGLR